MNEAQCTTRASLFETKLKNVIDELSANPGSVKGFKEIVSCSADIAYAIDLSKLDQVKDSFHDYPIIKSSVESGSNHNFFIIRDRKILDSFHIGELDISYPYYECFQVKGGKLNLLVEGQGGGARLLQAPGQGGCTFDKPYSLELASKDHARLISEIRDACTYSSKQCSLDEHEDLLFSNRTFIEQDGLIKVIVNIEFKDNPPEFIYYEHLPKCAADSLIRIFDGQTELGGLSLSNSILETRNLIGSDFEFKMIKPDPEMMWHFTGGNLRRKRIEYWIDALTEELESACKRQFRGLVTEAMAAVDPGLDGNAFLNFYNGFTEGGTDNCGQLCSDASICPTGELCDSDNDCLSAFGCDILSNPSVCS